MLQNEPSGIRFVYNYNSNSHSTQNISALTMSKWKTAIRRRIKVSQWKWWCAGKVTTTISYIQNMDNLHQIPPRLLYTGLSSHTLAYTQQTNIYTPRNCQAKHKKYGLTHTRSRDIHTQTQWCNAQIQWFTKTQTWCMLPSKNLNETSVFQTWNYTGAKLNVRFN